METSYSVIDMLFMQSPVLAQAQTAVIPVHNTGCLDTMVFPVTVKNLQHLYRRLYYNFF